MDNIEVLTRSEIRDYKGEHLYILNISDHNSTRPKQQLLMTFPINGTDIVIDVPNTWIPLDLTSKVTIEQIKANRDFWLFINRRDLAVVSTEIAEEFLEQDDAQAEYDRIHGIEQEDSKSVRINRSEARSLAKSRKPKGSIKVISIMKKNVAESMKLAALKNIKHELKEDDFAYILNEARVGEQEKLKAWALNPN